MGPGFMADAGKAILGLFIVVALVGLALGLGIAAIAWRLCH